jgi:hypothetical protein
VPWLRRLVAGPSPRRPGFAPETVHAGFVVDEVALWQVLLRVLRLFPVKIITPWLFILIHHLGMNNRLVISRSYKTVSPRHGTTTTSATYIWTFVLCIYNTERTKSNGRFFTFLSIWFYKLLLGQFKRIKRSWTNYPFPLYSPTALQPTLSLVLLCIEVST